MITAFDLFPFIRYLNRRHLSGNLPVRLRERILHQLVTAFCDYHSANYDDSMSPIDHIGSILQRNNLPHNPSWVKTLEEIFDQLELHLDDNRISLPVNGMLVADIDNGFLQFTIISDDLDVQHPQLTMKQFKEWIRGKDAESLYPIPREVYNLIDEFVNESGWIR